MILPALDIVQRDHDYALYLGQELIKTSDEYDFAHASFSKMQYLMFCFSESSGRAFTRHPLYEIFSAETGILKGESDHTDQSFALSFAEDLMIKNRLMGEKAQAAMPSHFLEDTEAYSREINVYFGAMATVSQKLNIFLSACGWDGSHEKIQRFAHLAYSRMHAAQKAVVRYLHIHLQSGIILPLLYASGHIRASEILIVALSNTSESMEIFREQLPQWYGTLGNITEYLQHSDDYLHTRSEAMNLTAEGESLNIEFKSSLRWNMYEKRADAAMEHACLKSMAAFLNSGGGTLIIGVADDKSICGITADQFKNDDKFLLHLWNLIKTYLGKEQCMQINTRLEMIQGKTVCLVQCLGSPLPVFMKFKNNEEEFFVRTGPSSTPLGVRETHEYIRRHFKD